MSILVSLVPSPITATSQCLMRGGSVHKLAGATCKKVLLFPLLLLPLISSPITAMSTSTTLFEKTFTQPGRIVSWIYFNLEFVRFRKWLKASEVVENVTLTFRIKPHFLLRPSLSLLLQLQPCQPTLHLSWVQLICKTNYFFLLLHIKFGSVFFFKLCLTPFILSLHNTFKKTQ